MLGAGLVKNLDRFPALMETGRQADSRVENTTKNNKRIWGLCDSQGSPLRKGDMSEKNGSILGDGFWEEIPERGNS